jgi:hypothetical protein
MVRDLFPQFFPRDSFTDKILHDSFGSGVISPAPTPAPQPSADDSGNTTDSPAPADGSSGGDDQAASGDAPAAADSSSDTASNDGSNTDNAPSRRRSFRFARDLAANETATMESTDSSSANSTTITTTNDDPSAQNTTTIETMSQNSTLTQNAAADGNDTDISTAIDQAINVADGKTNGTDDFAYGSIVDFSGKYVLGVSDDGNFYIDTIANQAQTIGFAFDQSVAIEDEESDLLFYYPDEM